MNKIERGRLTDTENKIVVSRGEGGGVILGEGKKELFWDYRKSSM